jgi:hypothetical protein
MLEAIEAHPIILLAVASLVVVVVISIERFITLYITYRLRVPPAETLVALAVGSRTQVPFDGAVRRIDRQELKVGDRIVDVSADHVIVAGA